MSLDFEDSISVILLALHCGVILYALRRLSFIPETRHKAWVWFILTLLCMVITRVSLMLRCLEIQDFTIYQYMIMMVTSGCLVNYIRLSGKE